MGFLEPKYKIKSVPYLSPGKELLFFVETQFYPFALHITSPRMLEKFPELVKATAAVHERLTFPETLAKTEGKRIKKEFVRDIFRTWLLVRNIFIYRVLLSEAPQELSSFMDFSLLIWRQAAEEEGEVLSFPRKFAQEFKRTTVFPYLILLLIVKEEQEARQNLEIFSVNKREGRLLHELADAVWGEPSEFSLMSFNSLFVKFQNVFHPGGEKVLLLRQGASERKRIRGVFTLVDAGEAQKVLKDLGSSFAEEAYEQG